MSEYWIADAQRPFWDGGLWCIGEDEHGELWVPGYRMSEQLSGHWVRFDRTRPRHWLCYLIARVRNAVVWLDWE